MSDGIGLADALLGLHGVRVLEVRERVDELVVVIESTATLGLPRVMRLFASDLTALQSSKTSTLGRAIDEAEPRRPAEALTESVQALPIRARLRSQHESIVSHQSKPRRP